ncbi:MAG: cysteine desulfurase [bacterium]|nr:cysteine desulfurase [bacterium]
MSTATELDNAEPETNGPPLDVDSVRRDFPIFKRTMNDHPLVYLDNAATSQKPQSVIDALNRYYSLENANIHRGVHELSQSATNAYTGARKRVARFLNALLPCEIVFVRGATEGINLVAQTFGRQRVSAGDEVLLTTMEHHSNIVPWQMLCDERGATLRVVPITDEGELVVEEYERLLNSKTKMVALNHMSNALGTVNPVKRLTEIAHSGGVPVLVDGAQSAPHIPVDVRDIGCDFFVCSGHKLFGPTGIGALYGKAEHLEEMPPWQGGGDMILSVRFDKTVYNTLPHKFEAGTPHIAGAIGLTAAIDYIEGIGLDRIAAYEHQLLEHGTEVLSSIDGVRLVGTAKEKAGVLSFTMDSAHPHDIGQIFDDEGIAIRTGHHCAQPVMERFGIPATARASFAFYNTKAELDAMGAAVRSVKEIFD